MMAVRTWSLPYEPPPSPPQTPAQMMRAAGLVDPLLAALLPEALTGEGSVIAAGGGHWRVTRLTHGDTLTIVALDTTEAVVAQRVLDALAGGLDADSPQALLAALPDPLRLHLGDGVVAAGGAATLDALEREAVQAAWAGERVWSDEGWGAAPLRVGGAIVGVVLGPAEDRAGRVLLEAYAVALAAVVARWGSAEESAPDGTAWVRDALEPAFVAVGGHLAIEGRPELLEGLARDWGEVLVGLVGTWLEPRAQRTLWVGLEGSDVVIEVVGGGGVVSDGLRERIDALGGRQAHDEAGSRVWVPRAGA